MVTSQGRSVVGMVAIVVLLGACDQAQIVEPHVSPESTPPLLSTAVESTLHSWRDGDSEIYTWYDTDGNFFRMEDRYDHLDRLVQRSHFLNGIKVGDLHGGLPHASHSYYSQASSGEWATFDHQLNVVGNSWSRGGENTGPGGPGEISDPGMNGIEYSRALSSAHPCTNAFHEMMFAKFVVLNTTVGAWLSQRPKRINGRIVATENPSAGAINAWGGSVVYWFARMHLLDQCVAENGRPGPWSVCADCI